jgi:predicted dehydrogenase
VDERPAALPALGRSLRDPRRGRLTFELGASWLRREQGSTVQTWQCPGDASGLIPMVQALRESIRTGQEPEMSGTEGLRDLAVVLKAYESIEQGVSLPV